MRDVFCYQPLQRHSRAAGPQCPFFLPSSASEPRLVSVCLCPVRILSADTIIGKNSLKEQPEVVNCAVVFMGLLLKQSEASCSPSGVPENSLHWTQCAPLCRSVTSLVP